MFLVGLTGGIASGKTLVSDFFESLGVTVIDADVLARVAVEPDSKGLNKLAEHFGSEILTNEGELNRSVLRNLIFTNPDHRKTVDAILHPIIRALSDERIELAASQDQPYAIYAVPLLIETSQQERFDRILVVDVPVEVQIERLMQRDNSTRDKANAIVNSQATREQRLSIADDVIENNATKDAVQAHVMKLHARYLELAQQLTR